MNEICRTTLTIQMVCNSIIVVQMPAPTSGTPITISWATV